MMGTARFSGVRGVAYTWGSGDSIVAIMSIIFAGEDRVKLDFRHAQIMNIIPTILSPGFSLILSLHSYVSPKISKNLFRGVTPAFPGLMQFFYIFTTLLAVDVTLKGTLFAQNLFLRSQTKSWGSCVAAI